MSDIVEQLIESRSFKRNPIHWSIFYATASASVLMFIILCTLSAWSLHVGNQVSETLKDVQDLVPQIQQSLDLLEYICKHDNFTKAYGACPL